MALRDEKDSVDIKDVEATHLEGQARVLEIGTFRVTGLSTEDAEWFTSYPEEKRKKIFRKVSSLVAAKGWGKTDLIQVDIRLIPMLAFLYLAAHIDRANIGNAKIEGMIEDLNMTGVQYNTVLSIFFVPYVIFEIPSNVCLATTPPTPSTDQRKRYF